MDEWLTWSLPSADNLRQISTALDVSVDWLLCRVGDDDSPLRPQTLGDTLEEQLARALLERVGERIKSKAVLAFLEQNTWLLLDFVFRLAAEDAEALHQRRRFAQSRTVVGSAIRSKAREALGLQTREAVTAAGQLLQMVDGGRPAPRPRMLTDDDGDELADINYLLAVSQPDKATLKPRRSRG